MIKILIVDDEPDIESLFVQKFRKKIFNKEWKFIFSSNGKEALDTLTKHKDIELVLSDINMPVMDGLSFLQEIKNRKLSAKTVIISAYGDMKNIRTAMNRGAFDFITKPMNFDDVSNTIEKTLEHIKVMKQAKADQEKLVSLNKELEIAKNIQDSMLPPLDLSLPYCSIYAKIVPAKVVGGDFYDVFVIDSDHVGIVIADVSGKGVSSAVFAMAHQGLLKSISSSFLSPKKCVEKVNQLYSKNNENCMFVTLFYGVLNFKDSSLNYVNAGHNSPYKISDGKIEQLFSAGDPPLDVDSNVLFKENKIDFSKGDLLFLYTDGLTEAKNKDNEFFGENRLEKLLLQNTLKPIKEMGENIFQSIQNFSEEAHDDMAFLLCQYKN